MARHYQSKNARCPFYRMEERAEKRIYCEGVVPTSTTQLVFRGEEKMLEYRRRYCEGCYQDCMIAKMLFRKYDDKNNS